MLPLVWFVVISTLAKSRIDFRPVGRRTDKIGKTIFAWPIMAQHCVYITRRSTDKCFKVARALMHVVIFLKQPNVENSDVLESQWINRLSSQINICKTCPKFKLQNLLSHYTLIAVLPTYIAVVGIIISIVLLLPVFHARTETWFCCKSILTHCGFAVSLF